MKNSKSHKSENGAGEKREDFLIVGIGASAGGIQALKEFFENVPADSDLAYVVILHLSPDHDSRLAEVLQRAAQIPVTQVTEKTYLEPNRVYVVPPNQSLTMNDGYVAVSPIHTVEERRAPVDIFFRTLAESHQTRAIAVVLSGTGANGSMGIKRVKERGGAAFVQNPREAEFSEMPRNSMATDLIDAVLNVREIPSKIIAYKNNFGAVEIQENSESRPDDDQAALREVFTVLRVRTGHDFSNYKRPTVLRRIERRINVNVIKSLPAYADLLNKDLNEANALLKDLLISVTNFFRDKNAFDFLEQDVVPRLLEGRRAADQIRVWVAGCATGEEAYSLAMMLAERTQERFDAPSIQIFASDIDEAAIATAREGFYTLNDAADVSPERLQRFFTKEDGGFRIRRDLREMVLFANHNLLKDPPFSHLDLVTCRNLLIYFNAAAQERAMETFHFALNPGGFLFLGNSETTDGSGDLYANISREHHIYQSRQTSAKIAYPIPEAPPALRFAEAQTRLDNPIKEAENQPLERISFADLHRQLLEQYAPPSIVVNENYDIAHLSETAGRFLQIAGGEPSKNLLKLVRPELRLELRTALYQAAAHRANVEAKNVKVRRNGNAETINIHVRPVLEDETISNAERETQNAKSETAEIQIPNSKFQIPKSNSLARGFFLVLFEPSQTETIETAEQVLTALEPMAQRLEEELERTKTQLRTSVEQFEAQTEELRASNEELQAMNEEMRSTAEELETSREELQSVNEELLTVNQELKIKIEELSHSNSDFQNLMNSTDIGTIFLDRSLRVKMFTPTVKDIFNLIEADLNRPLADITTKLDFDDLLADITRVLDTSQTIEREVETDRGKWYLMRIYPYLTAENTVSGAVVAFVDITRRKLLEERLSEAATERLERQARIFDTTLSTITDFAYTFDRDGRFIYANRPLLDLLGITLEEIIGKNFFDLNYPDDLAAKLERQIQQVLDTQNIVKDETPFTSPTGTDGFYEYIFSPFVAADGSVELVVGSTRDVTTRRAAEDSIRFQAQLLNTVEQAVIATDLDGTVVYWNNHAEKLYGWTAAEATGRIVTELTTSQVMAEQTAEIMSKLRRGESWAGEFQVRRRNGRTFLAQIFNSPIEDEQGKLIGVVGVSIDITERKQTEEALRKSEERFRALIDKSVDVITISDRDGNITYASPSIEAMSGYAVEEFVSQNPFAATIHPDDLPMCQAALQKLTEHPGESVFLQHRYLHKSGKWRWLEGTFTSMFHDSSVGGLVANFRDFTDRKRAEEALRESEERFRAMFEQANIGIVQIAFDGKFLAVNPGFCKIVGYSKEELQKLTVRDITHPNDYKLEEAENRRLIAGEVPGYSIEERCFHKNGSIVWKMMTATLARRESGEPFYILSIVEDITTRKLAEEALRESEERFRLLVESVTDYAIFAVNEDNLIVSWNAGAEKVFGFAEREIIGKSGEILFTPEDRAADVPERELQTAAAVGRAEDERWHVRQDGSRFYASGVMTGLKDSKGFVKIARDMTDKIKVETALREKEILQRMVGAQEDERRRIARDLHDHLGQQLTALKLKLEAARKMSENNSELSAKIDETQLIAKRIDADVDFLAWELRPAALDDLGLLTALENYVKEWSCHSGITAEFFTSGVSKERFTPEVEINLYRITQEALNNVYKHAKATRASLILEKRDGLLILIVEDDGIGFDAEDKEIRRNGLGLIGMKERAALVGGTKEIESEKDMGTTIYVRVPLAESKNESSRSADTTSIRT